MKFLHIKKIKSIFSFTSLINSILFPCLALFYILHEIADSSRLYSSNSTLFIIVNVLCLCSYIILGTVNTLFKRGEIFNKEDFLNSMDNFYYFKIFIFKILLTILMVTYEINKISSLFYVIIVFSGITIVYFTY